MTNKELEYDDAIKLLKTIVEPCEAVDNHSWRRCKRCLAIHGIENRFPKSIYLLKLLLIKLEK